MVFKISFQSVPAQSSPFYADEVIIIYSQDFLHMFGHSSSLTFVDRKRSKMCLLVYRL